MPDRTVQSLKMLPGECWWGGVVRHGDRMPYDGSAKVVDHLCSNLDGNQGCPLYVSSLGRYIWSEKPYSIEFGKETIQLTDIVGVMELGEGHKTLKGAYLAAANKFFPPSGKIPHELNFTAPQYNGWIEMHRYPTQEKVMKYAERILKAKMPPGILMVDDYWYTYPGHWDFDCAAFPDPKGMVDKLHQQGFLVMLWVCPCISPDSRQHKEFREKGWLLRHSDGREAIHEWWGSWSSPLDLSHPDCFAWFQGKLDYLMTTYGIDGFKFDGGDPYRFQSNDLSFAPRTPAEHCEDFGRIGLKYRLSEYRACWKLGGQHLLQRVRDKNHLWGVGGLADTIPTTLAQGLIGYPYSAPDMVGGGAEMESAPFQPELYIRWAQAGTFFPITQYSNLPDGVLDAKHLAICNKYVALRQQLSGEILDLAKHASKTGEPIMRHMAYEFPGEGFEKIADQFMLGTKYLVAPVLTKGSVKKKIKFPKGTWKGDDGSTVQGPCETEVEAPLERIPYYIKQA